jgi:predicted DsbA family dithiol-disulfide isomerase
MGDSKRTRVIEVFADAVCPFTYVGLRRLFAHRDRWGRDDVAVRVRAWPLELVNGEPLPAALLAEEVAELRQSIAPELFNGFDADRFPMTSRPALALAARAYRVGDREGERVSMALREALFEQGLDISDDRTLTRIARAAGVDHAGPEDEAAVLADLAEGRARGVVGSPHFFVDGDDWFCPTLQISRADGHLTIAFDATTMAAFLQRCFAEPGSVARV